MTYNAVRTYSVKALTLYSEKKSFTENDEFPNIFKCDKPKYFRIGSNCGSHAKIYANKNLRVFRDAQLSS